MGEFPVKTLGDIDNAAVEQYSDQCKFDVGRAMNDIADIYKRSFNDAMDMIADRIELGDPPDPTMLRNLKWNLTTVRMEVKDANQRE